ncbi:MAG TPA: hypothetical protein PK349_00260 [Candidatus Hydrogenedentes bacterium]|nr:hypothetical protein [Candidatus Hydrogenedentota bacterium]
MEIRIGKIGRQCSACGAPFQHQEKVRSLATRAESDSIKRLDFCAVCAGRVKEEEVYCAWTATYQDPEILRQTEAGDEALSPLRRIFYASCEEPDREKGAVAFLAAEMLRRQRAFRKIRENQGEGAHRVVWYLDRAVNRIIEVRDPSFSYAELDRARVILMEAMKTAEPAGSGPEVPAPTASSAAPISSGKDMT